MKYLATLLVFSIVLISGCAQGNNASSATDNPGYSDSAPAKMLETPEKARNEADKASERMQGTVDAVEGINAAP